ncbi:uncharacterized protein LOC109597479 [Aethina tumida]|uniref:uncharacterized protein LOC109597479 n=1 Tax=Aethina tumida TaxID=116153 RepID=UPI00096B32D7|nr:uncharacterized protein LOC109597479 [Aethina tumida]
MNYLQCIFSVLLIAIICVKTGFAISCYECNSATDKRCLGDEHNRLSDDLKKPCPERSGQPYKLCRKIKQMIDFEVNGLQPDSRVIRTCGYDDSTYKDRCYQRSGFGGRQEVCTCETEGCNSGIALLPSMYMLLGLYMLLKLNW